MIVFLTTAAFRDVLRSLTGSGYGADLPEIRVESYEETLRKSEIPWATYVFCDLERLTGFELRVAGALYVALAATGVRTLNNPARIKLRYEMLKQLAAVGINPFNVHRCDDRPSPRRFPVFIRAEDGHIAPDNRLLNNQAELEAALEDLRRRGESPKGLLAVEWVPSDRYEGRWHKWGAFCISGQPVLDHIAVDGNWLVKLGRWEQLTPGIVAIEHSAVMENRHADFVRQIFGLAGIDFGRADIGICDGRPVVYEINTNPVIHDYRPDPHLLRQQTVKMARTRFASALFAIDSVHGGLVEVPSSAILAYCRRTRPGVMFTPRV